MSRRRAGGAVLALVAAGLLGGCSGADDDPAPESPTSSVSPSSPRTPPPISPRTTVSLPSGSTLPEVTPPSSSAGGPPVPIPSEPAD